MRIEGTLNFQSYMRIALAIAQGLLSVVLGLLGSRPSVALDTASLVEFYASVAGLALASGVLTMIAAGLVSFPFYVWLSKRGFFSLLEGKLSQKAE